MKKLPIQLYIGISLVLIFWILNWSLSGLRTQWLFFPLWLGYAITIDSLVYIRKGTSLSKRSLTGFILLFIFSIPAWWIFEFLNQFTHNWYYDGRQYFSNVEYSILASISFSTVMPAVFGTAELASTFKWIKGINKRWIVEPTNQIIEIFFAAGFLMLFLLLIFPNVFYVFIWLAVFFIVEPLNYKLKINTLFDYIRVGNWRPVVALCIGSLICGFFWEMWNYLSYPHWIYFVPGVNFLHIFEMPLLGYLGYIPFALELYSIYNLVAWLTKNKKLVSLLEIDL
jgi:hypothetical protein